MGRRQCEQEGCSKRGLGSTRNCKAHGGGKRCQEEGCTKYAAAGGTPHCIAHGGGKRCQEEDCTKSAQGGTGHCKAHGGGRRCQAAGCLTAARPGKQQCHAHAWRWHAVLGGRLPQGSSRQHATLRRARRRQAVSARGLLQVGSSRRHAPLQGAWRRQAVPRRGLHQGGCCRRYTPLHTGTRSVQVPVAHGGGRRCQHEGCSKAVEGGGTPHCKAHGGGRRCQEEGCTKSAAPEAALPAQDTARLMAGANGARRTAASRPEGSSRRHGCLHGAWWRQALPEPGLPQGS
jgi:hypothetical protein